MKMNNDEKRNKYTRILKCISSAASWIEEIMDDPKIKNNSSINDKIDNFFVDMSIVGRETMKLLSDIDDKILPKIPIKSGSKIDCIDGKTTPFVTKNWIHPKINDFPGEVSDNYLYEEDWAGLN